MRFLLSALVVMAPSGCTSTERQASIQEKSLALVAAAYPIGTSADSVRTITSERKWTLQADQALTHWPLRSDGPTVDRVFSIMLPKHVGIPFSISVFAYVGTKDGRVVGHHVVVEPNAL